MAAVELRELDKWFPGDVHAVARLNLAIAPGELLVLVGPSGCGKSTVLRMIAGLEHVTSGEILIEGEVVNVRSPQERNVAMVFQNYALYPHKSVRKNLEFPLKMARRPKVERRRQVREVAELLGLSDIMSKRPAELSGGQRQRVAMGRAMVREPAVSLLDEPLSNLDAKLRVQIRSEIAQLQKRLGTTTLYVTHDQVEAMTLGHRVAVLNQGRLQQLDSGQELYDRPANIFVATFIGSPAMNVFPARLQHAEGSFYVPFGDTYLPVPNRLAESHRLDRFLDTPIHIGIRPEGISLIDEPRRPGFSAKVVSVEALGHEHIIYLESPVELLREANTTSFSDSSAVRQALTVRVPSQGDAPTPGATLSLRVDCDQLFFFDADGTALVHSLSR